MNRRRDLFGIYIGTVGLEDIRPAVFIDINGKAKVYFSPKQAIQLADELREEAYYALGHSEFGHGSA